MSPGVSSLVLWTLFTASTAQQADQQAADAPRETLRSVEAFRGGRHWADAETAPPRSPEESLKSLKTEPGVTIELFASEPLVMDPVAIAFDWQGRMFVVEYGDYPTGSEDGGPSLSRVVLLEDTDGDGKADQRTVFADHLTFAHSLLPYDGGIIVGAQTQLLFLKDTDGDNVADERQVLFEGFKPAHPQMQIGNPRYGLDNRIFCNYGPGKIRSPWDDGEPLDMPRQDFRFSFLTKEFGPASGMGQFGNTIDNRGNRFFCTNRNPVMTAMLPHEVVRRNPYAVIAKAHYDVAPSGGETRVYPLVEMKSNYLSHAGTHTSACGVTAYRGSLFDDSFEHSVFVCEPIGHLVTRSVVRRDGLRLKAQRARPKADFIASTDTWFRPASLATGPEGALYLADMYRLWVEHPKFLPEEVAKKLDWRAGEDRGRVYRIRPDGQSLRRPMQLSSPLSSPTATDELAALLSDANGWRRSLAQQYLVQKATPERIETVQTILAEADSAPARLHALWIMDGWGLFDAKNESSAKEKSSVKDQPADASGSPPADGTNRNQKARAVLQTALQDDDSHVRAAAVQIAADHLATMPSLAESVIELADDSQAPVRFQVALALGGIQSPETTAALSKLALTDGHDEWFRKGILTSSAERSGAILGTLLRNRDFTEKGESHRIDLIRDLATVVGARGDLNELNGLLRTITLDSGEEPAHATAQAPAWWQTAAVSGLAIGLPRHRGELGRVSLASLLAKPPEELADSMEEVRQLVDRSETVALDRQASITDREAAIELLSHQSFERVSKTLAALLATSQPVAIQSAAIDALRRNGSAGVAGLILDRWETLSPLVKQSAIGLLFRRTPAIIASLKAMEAGRLNRSAVDLNQRVRLLKSSNDEIRKLAEKVFGGAVSSNRREVAATYRAALDREASVERGRKVFQRVCSKCHKIDGKGFEVGPDISDVRNRSREALLYDILDPNSKVEPRYAAYTIATDDGRVFNGLLISESAEAVVLRQPEGKQEVIPRSNIEAIRSTGKSLMPEGVEKDVTVQQMADLLKYLKSRR